MQGCKKHDYFSLSSLNIPFSNTAITVMNHLHLCTKPTLLENDKKVAIVSKHYEWGYDFLEPNLTEENCKK